MIHWTSQEFTIACENGPRNVKGWISDDKLWGISKQKWIGKNKDKFKITHIRTGLNIKRGLATVNECKIICDNLSKQGSRWDFGVFGVKPMLSKKEKTMRKNIVEQAALGAL